MTEDRAENSEVKTASVPGTNHGLLIKLVGYTDPRCERLPCWIPIEIAGYATRVRNADKTIVDVQKATELWAIDRFREIQLPAQSIVHAQFAGCAPGILRIEEQA